MAPEWEKTIVTTLKAVSVIFILITLIIYAQIKTLRGPEDIAFMISIGCIALFFTFSILQYLLADFDFLRNFFYHFNIYIGTALIVAYFSWLNVTMMNQLRKNL